MVDDRPFWCEDTGCAEPSSNRPGIGPGWDRRCHETWNRGIPAIYGHRLRCWAEREARLARGYSVVAIHETGKGIIPRVIRGRRLSGRPAHGHQPTTSPRRWTDPAPNRPAAHRR